MLVWVAQLEKSLSKEPKQGAVLVMGSINTDLVARSLYLPRPGETIEGHSRHPSVCTTPTGVVGACVQELVTY